MKGSNFVIIKKTYSVLVSFSKIKLISILIFYCIDVMGIGSGSNRDEDEVLLQKLKKGDENSFRQIYEKFHRQLYSVALKYLRSPELSEDAVHDVFLKLWKNRKRLNRSGSLRGFLFTAVKNHVLNMINSNKRKLKKHVKLLYEREVERLESNNVIVLSEYKELYELATTKLPEKRREIFKLKADEGLTNKEVADYLGISIHTVKSQYYKASNFIRDYVNEHINRKTGTGG